MDNKGPLRRVYSNNAMKRKNSTEDPFISKILSQNLPQYNQQLKTQQPYSKPETNPPPRHAGWRAGPSTNTVTIYANIFSREPLNP